MGCRVVFGGGSEHGGRTGKLLEVLASGRLRVRLPRFGKEPGGEFDVPVCNCFALPPERAKGSSRA